MGPNLGGERSGLGEAGWVSDDWIEYLTPDEISAIRETNDWLSVEASRFKKVMGITRKPMEYVYKKVPESIREGVATAILKVLTSMRDGTAGVVKAETVYQRIEEHHGPIDHEVGIIKVGVRKLDKACFEGLRKSKNVCTVEGAATGAVGLPGIVLDVPALYGLLFHMIQEVALCYGYDVEPEEEKAHILKILNIGHHMERADKKKGMEELESIQDMIRDGVPVGDVEKFAVQKGLQTMARHLSLALLQRKLAQSVVLVGGVIGAGVNRKLAGEVGEVAHHAYRRRFLQDKARARMEGKLKMPRSVSAPEKPSEPKSALLSKLPKPPSYDG